MISRISLLKCKEGVSEEAFREGMMGGVRDVIARMPQLRKCEIDFVTDRQQRSHLGRGAIDIDDDEQITLTPKGRYMMVAMMRQFFIGVNGVRDDARASLPTDERDLLFGAGVPVK